MQEFTEKDCMQTEKEISIRTGWWFFPSKVLPEHYTGQLFFCTNIQKTENPRHSIAHLVSLSTGEAWHSLEQGCGWCAATRNCWGKGTALALPDPSIWGHLDLHGHSPEYSGYSFLPDGRYASGYGSKSRGSMELCNDAEGLPVSVLICDRDDFAVLEMLEEG